MSEHVHCHKCGRSFNPEQDGKGYRTLDYAAPYNVLWAHYLCPKYARVNPAPLK